MRALDAAERSALAHRSPAELAAERHDLQLALAVAPSPAQHHRALAAGEVARRELLDAHGRRDQADERLAGLQEAPWFRRNRQGIEMAQQVPRSCAAPLNL